ncbi:MAG: hypothetical protein Q9182_001670 [Xanthomendoza sp. 2 TL-2023]
MPAQEENDPVEARRIVTMRPNDPHHGSTALVMQYADSLVCSQANIDLKIAALEAQIEDTKVKLHGAAAKLKNPDPGQTVNNHIRLLREYNHIRDIGTSLMAIIASHRQVQLKRVYEDFPVDEKD